jgi:Protein of unknown function (DUF2281)
MDSSSLHKLIDQLPGHLQKKVYDFANSLINREKQVLSKKPRVLDLHKGQVWMSEDFDEPLPDEFWLGDDK